ncbi:MAG: penicillin-binding protein activator LpoB, partial [gamma proteobacterium symbiont of Lucinoma myriamae]|nr:penicillin-binding protein activator LpoB [gamma proteobacterium symbiont of Lucinoma myriamae]MCU7833516.1 penicillin-binding protein activator LpoB [gamma proteobacterium symbiont of Lucinoma myriamae]
MLNKLILLVLMLVFVNACQTHLPIAAQMEGMENSDCPKNIEQIELADIDYLLYANRMVDDMIQDHNVQEALGSNRLKIAIQPISHENNIAQINMDAINLAIKNRILRSGQFIIVYARHGHKLMGCKSPVGGSPLCKLYPT